MKRRAFVKSTCNTCLLMAAGYFVPKLSGCAPAKFATIKTEVINKQITVPLAAFANTNMQLLQPKGWYYNIAVQKKSDNSFSALLLQCTHQENQLTPTMDGFHCSFHGSDFDKNGNVRKGPAEDRLVEYPIAITGNILIIQITKTPQ